MKYSLLAFVALVVSGCAEAASYSINESLSGQSFLDAFVWQAIPDPTYGRVSYVTQATAQSAGLYLVSGNNVILRADNTTVLSPSGPGRNSFRLMSNDQYSNHVAIFDIRHMPEGCGTWPAVWSVSRFTLGCSLTFSLSDLGYIYIREVGADWPNTGEIDIVEGVNNETPNQSTLHTSANCTMPSSRMMTGKSVGADCSAGCGVQTDDDNSFGPNFNTIGGGWYAIERGSTYISIYFWERGDSSVPSEVQYPGSTVNTSTWGTPAAYFPNTDCNFPSHFGPMNIIINLTFCGQWAGAVYAADGCPSTCVDYVNDNPGAFSNAYFEFNALNIYQ